MKMIPPIVCVLGVWGCIQQPDQYKDVAKAVKGPVLNAILFRAPRIRNYTASLNAECSQKVNGRSLYYDESTRVCNNRQLFPQNQFSM